MSMPVQQSSHEYLVTSASYFSVLTRIICNGPLGSHEIKKIKQEMVGPFHQVLEWSTFSVEAAEIRRGEAEIPHWVSEWVKGLGGRSGLNRPAPPKRKTGASWTDFHLAHITDLLDSISKLFCSDTPFQSKDEEKVFARGYQTKNKKTLRLSRCYQDVIPWASSSNVHQTRKGERCNQAEGPLGSSGCNQRRADRGGAEQGGGKSWQPQFQQNHWQGHTNYVHFISWEEDYRK